MSRSAIVVACLMAGCSSNPGFEGAVDPQSVSAALAVVPGGAQAPAVKAWASYEARTLSFEMSRSDGARWATHHLDVMSLHGQRLVRDPGSSYFDGPDVNGRGTVGDRVGPSGIIEWAGDSWIDLLYCPGPDVSQPGCEMARTIQLRFDAAGDGKVRATYRAQIANGEITGSFLTPQNPDGAENDPHPAL